MTLLEICIDSFDSAVTAERAGAHRLEVCQDLSLAVGGVTPTAGFIKVVRQLVKIPIYVLIRPRPGDFCYDERELDQMIHDIKISKQYGANGLVFGALKKDGTVDMRVCKRLIEMSSGLPVTFNRAFDEAQNKEKALEDVIRLEFHRVLTSGGAISAFDGIDKLQSLITQANSRIIVMPGGGVHDKNIYEILTKTKAVEIHSSGRKPGPGLTRNSRNCCQTIVTNMRQIIDWQKLDL